MFYFILFITLIIKSSDSASCNQFINLTITCFDCSSFLPSFSCLDGNFNDGKSYFIIINDLGLPTDIEEHDLKKIQNSIENDDQSDIYLIKNEHVKYLYEEFTYVNKSDGKYDSFIMENIFDELYNDVSVEGVIYGIPWISDRSVIWYSNYYHNSFGFDDPPWTMEYFDEMLKTVRESDVGWWIDYPVFHFSTILKEDLTGWFVELLNLAGSKIVYNDQTGDVKFTNRVNLENKLKMVIDWVNKRCVFKEFLEVEENILINKWLFQEIIYIREYYSWRDNFKDYIGIYSDMRVGYLNNSEGSSVTSQKGLSFAIKKDANIELAKEIVNDIITFSKTGSYNQIKKNYAFDHTSPIVFDSDVGEFGGGLFPENEMPPHQVIVEKPFSDEKFYFTLSLYLQTTLRRVLTTGFVTEHLDNLESDLKEVFNIVPLEKEIWKLYYWVTPLVVIAICIVVSFPVMSILGQTCVACKRLNERRKLKKFHVDTEETRKKIREYFKCSIRTCLMMFFIFFLFLSVFLVFWITYQNTTQAIDLLGKEWKIQVLKRIDDSLKITFSAEETEVAMDNAKTKLFDLLESIQVTENSVKFTINHNSTVIGSDHPHIPRENKLCTSSHPLVIDFCTFVENKFDGRWDKFEFSDASTIRESYVKLIFKSGNQDIWVDGMFFKDVYVDWTIIILTPSEDLLNSISTGNAFSILFSLGIVIVATSFSILITVLITESLSKLATQMRKVQGMDLNVKFKKSFFHEIADIQERFIELLETLAEYKKFLPANMDMEIEEDEEDMNDQSMSILSTALGFGALKKLDRTDAKTVQVRNKVQNFAIKRKLATKSVSVCQCTVLNCRIVNFDEFATASLDCPDDFIQIHTKYMECVTKRIQEYDGTFSSFFGSEVFCSFNASKPCPKHEKSAGMCALKIIRDIREINKKIDEFDYPRFVISIAVSSGSCWCGNLGTTNVRNFSLIGDLISKNEIYEKLNCIYQTKILVNIGMYEMLVDEGFSITPVEIISFDSGKTKEVLFDLSGIKKSGVDVNKSSSNISETITDVIEVEKKVETSNDTELPTLTYKNSLGGDKKDDVLDNNERIKKAISLFLEKKYSEIKPVLRPMLLQLQRDKPLKRFHELVLKLTLSGGKRGGYYVTIDPTKTVIPISSIKGRRV